MAPSQPPAPDLLARDRATADVPRVAPHDAAGAVRRGLEGRSFACADDVAVLDGERLVGLLPIERLLAAPADAVIADLMDADPPIVAPGSDEEAVAWKMVRRGESSVAVVAADGTFQGFIPPHRMIAALLAAHDRDMARIGGYLSRAQGARQAAEEPLRRRLWHRLPWLVLGLAGAMLSAVIVDGFEADIERNLLLAVFVPAVVYMADAVGTQTDAVLIRGLSAGIDLRLVARREAATGAILGVLLASVFLPFVWLAWGEGRVALSVALALLAACAIATIVAMALPWLLMRMGRDPAFGSGPLATVVQDLLSILVYFAVATAVL